MAYTDERERDVAETLADTIDSALEPPPPLTLQELKDALHHELGSFSDEQLEWGVTILVQDDNEGTAYGFETGSADEPGGGTTYEQLASEIDSANHKSELVFV